MCSWKIHDIIPNERHRAGESEMKRRKHSKGSKTWAWLAMVSSEARRGFPKWRETVVCFLRGSRFHPFVPPLCSRADWNWVWGSLWWQCERCAISSVRVCVCLTGAEVTLRFRWSQNVIMPQWTKGESNTKQLDVFDSDSRHIDRGMNSSLSLSLCLS